MTFSLEVVPTATIEEDNFKEHFLSKCEFGSFNSEQENVGIILDRVKKHRVRLHVLLDEDTNTLYGFVALRLSSMYGNPCAVIDFLFTSCQFRKQVFADLDDLKTSDYLLVHAIDTARRVSAVMPVAYVALQSIDFKLLPFYGAKGFKVIDESWMTLKI